MKKFAALVLSLLLVFTVAFSDVACANASSSGFKTYTRENVFLIVNDLGAIVTWITENGDFTTAAYSNSEFCAFSSLYYCFISNEKDCEGTFLRLFQGCEDLISLEGYTPICFGEDHITLKKDGTFFKVDIEQTNNTSKLVVIPID